MFNRKKRLKFRINIFDRIGKMIQRNLIEKYIIWIELINYFQHQYFKSIFNEMLKKKFSKPQLSLSSDTPHVKIENSDKNRKFLFKIILQ